MSITRVGRRTVTVVLVGALICTALPFATSGGPGGIARAAEPRLPSLALPADEDGTADAGLRGQRRPPGAAAGRGPAGAHRPSDGGHRRDAHR